MHGELKHFGVLGMRWGHRKAKENSKNISSSSIKLSYRDKTKADYISRGYSEKDAEVLALRKSKIRTAALIAGGVTVAVGAALAARYMKMELKDMHLKPGSKTFHIDRAEVKPLEKGRNFFITANKADRTLYKNFLFINNDMSIPRIERTFEVVKDIKIPNAKKSKKLFNEFLNDKDNYNLFKKAFGGKKEYADFVKFSPYFSDKDTAFGIKNESGFLLWKKYQTFIMSKGYAGLLDENDRWKSGFKAEQPVVLFDAAVYLKEHSVTKLKKPNNLNLLMPRVRDITSIPNIMGLTTITAIIGFSTHENTKSLEAYRKTFPNSEKSNKEILYDFQYGNVPSVVYEEMAKL